MRWTVGLMLLAGMLVRLPGLAAPPLSFHPTRQYAGAIIASMSSRKLSGAPRPILLRFYAENGDGQRAEIGSRTIVDK